VSGFNVYPNEVEGRGRRASRRRGKSPQIAQPDEASGEVVVLFVVSKGCDLTGPKLIAHCRTELPDTKCETGLFPQGTAESKCRARFFAAPLRDELGAAAAGHRGVEKSKSANQKGDPLTRWSLPAARNCWFRSLRKVRTASHQLPQHVRGSTSPVMPCPRLKDVPRPGNRKLSSTPTSFGAKRFRWGKQPRGPVALQGNPAIDRFAAVARSVVQSTPTASQPDRGDSLPSHRAPALA